MEFQSCRPTVFQVLVLLEVDDELPGETERYDSNWVDEAASDDGELFSGVWSVNYQKIIS